MRTRLPRNRSVSLRLNDTEKDILTTLCEIYECNQQQLIRNLLRREGWRFDSFGKSENPGVLDEPNYKIIDAYCEMIGRIFGVKGFYHEHVIPSRFTQLRGKKILEELNKVYPMGALILRKRHGIDGSGGLTLRQAGEMLDIPFERVRQIEAKAFRILRHPGFRKYLSETLISNSIFRG